MNASDRLKQLKEEQNRNRDKVQENNKKATRFAIVFIICCVIICIIFLIIVLGDSGNTKYVSSSNNNLNSTCYYYSQRLVKEKLKSPDSAEFPKYSASFVEKSGDTVTVSAYVNAQNSFGATIKTDYIATIKIENNKPVSGSVVLIE